ncbi:hypothetical protein [Streptomyces virginiae]
MLIASARCSLDGCFGVSSRTASGTVVGAQLKVGQACSRPAGSCGWWHGVIYGLVEGFGVVVMRGGVIVVARLLGRQEFDARVEFRGFAFQESDESVVPVPFPDDFQWGVFLQAHVRRFDLFSAGHTHTAAVTARVWDSQPDTDSDTDADAGDWDERAEIDYESVTGNVAVWGSGRSEDLIRLGRPGTWRVRVTCVGRAEVEAVTRSEGTAYRVEHYTIDFWPTAL